MKRTCLEFWWVALMLGGASACTVMDGQCWYKDENGTGDGAGGQLVGTGQGGYGDASPKPQAADDSRPPPDCASVGMFSPSLFKFVTIVADDGTMEPGGWQEAGGTFNFVDTQDSRSYSCSIKVGMPLRTAAQGKISHAMAADMSATVMTFAGPTVMHQKTSWVTAQFCEAVRAEMTKLFDEGWPKLGERVTQ